MNILVRSKDELEYGNISRKEEIAQELLNEIESGTLKRGEQIPSQKALAQKYNVDPKTIEAAVGILTNRNILYTKARKGTYVSASALMSSAEIFESFLLRNRFPKKSKSSTPENYYVQIGSLEINPYFFLQHCAKSITDVTVKLIGQSFDTWSQYLNFGKKINKLLLEQVSIREGRKYLEKNFLLLAGKFHCLNAIARTISKPTDIVLMASPIVDPYYKVFKTLGLEIWELPRTPNGLDIDDLISSFKKAELQKKNIAFAYLNLQLDFSKHRMEQELIDKMNAFLAKTKEFGILILEEFEDHEITYTPPLTFSSISSTSLSNVISIRTYSKLLYMYNEFRVVLAPEDMIHQLQRAKELEVQYGMLYNMLASMLLEANIFLKVSESVSKNFQVYTEKIILACEERLAVWANVHRPNSGVCFWVTAKPGYEFYIPVKALKKLNLLRNYGAKKRHDKLKTKSILFALGSVNTHDLKIAIDLIAQSMEESYPSKFDY